MEVGLFSIGIGRAAHPERIAQIAHKADEVGFAILWAPEHVVLFEAQSYTSRYPYNDTGRIGAEQSDFLDPFTALAFAAAHSRRIKLGTGICLVPERHPLHTAKLVASVDRLSQGRFVFGVGIGWLKEELQALGVPPEHRAERTCEYLDAMRAVWTQDTPSFRGEFCTFTPLKSLPKPVQRPHPPILFGGNSLPALRRAVVNGDGWFGFNVGPDEAAPLVQRLHQIAGETGRPTDQLMISLAPATKLTHVTLDDLKRYRDAGVQQVTVRLPTTQPEAIDRALEDMAERLVVPALTL